MRRRVSTALNWILPAPNRRPWRISPLPWKICHPVADPASRSSVGGKARRSLDRVGYLAKIPLDLAALRRRLATCLPAAAGITDKSFANIKSGFLAAVKASGINWLIGPRKLP